MAKKPIYPYSKELKIPADTSKYNYDDPKMAAGMLKSGQFMQLMTKLHRSPKAVRRSICSFISFDGSAVPFHMFEPKGRETEILPCVIYYHGGGFMFPVQTMMMMMSEFFVQKLQCRVILPEYRLSPQTSCKTVIEDCFYCYKHVFEKAEDYHIDTKKVIVYGDSAGGALAAGVTHLARDRKAPSAAGQMLIYPVTDNHSERYGSMEKYSRAAWPANANRWMWKQYFSHGADGMENYAAPLNMNDFSGLPPAYVEPQEIDILKDEGIAYAEKLKQEGTLIEMNIVKGSYHGFETDWKSPLTKRVIEHRCEVMARMVS